MTRPAWAQIDETHDPARTSWVESANGHPDFPIQNLPFGVFSPRGGVAIGDLILDLSALLDEGALYLDNREILGLAAAPTLNGFLAAPAAARRELRQALSAWLSDQHTAHALAPPFFWPMAECTLHMPASVGDYTDFYAGIRHAENVGRLFRPDQPLLPNYKYVPIAYHGRASSVRASGALVIRPNGQTKGPGDDSPRFGPSARLDYEVELGVWLAGGNAPGVMTSIADAGDQVAGVCLLNDWSARDLQTWEYQPLGPFLAKSFATTVSPWIVMAEALAPFRTAQPPRPEGDPAPLPHLWHEADQAFGALALEIEVWLRTPSMTQAERIALCDARDLYWTLGQMVAHHGSNGCDLRSGDLFGTGTISGAAEDSVGSLLERTVGGSKPLRLASGEERTFLKDGDEVVLIGRCRADGYVSIGTGACVGMIAPAPALG
jgi:fumarylacetoacetase